MIPPSFPPLIRGDRGDCPPTPPTQPVGRQPAPKAFDSGWNAAVHSAPQVWGALVIHLFTNDLGSPSFSPHLKSDPIAKKESQFIIFLPNTRMRDRSSRKYKGKRDGFAGSRREDREQREALIEIAMTFL